MSRVWDFVRNLSYIMMLVALYLGINQVLVITDWHEPGKQNFVSDILGIYDRVMAYRLPSESQVELIDQYLVQKESPLAGQGVQFVAVAEKYQLPLYLLVAMTGAESNFGKVGYANDGSFNAVGLGIHEGRRYDSWETGIEDLGFVLRNYYFDEGRTSPTEIQEKWAPRNVDGNGSDNSWADNVNYFMTELEEREVSN